MTIDWKYMDTKTLRDDIKRLGITPAKYDIVSGTIRYISVVYFQNQEDLNFYRLSGNHKESISLRFLNIQEPHPGTV